MTRLFGEDGQAVPVTVIEVQPNRVTQVKDLAHDGYVALQVTTGEVNAARLTRAVAGHFAKAGAGAGRGMWEFRVDAEVAKGFKPGDVLDAGQFAAGNVVDVTATSRGKGFQGVVKRWNFRGGAATHGNSLSHRVPGSIGQRQTPGRVFKNKKMAGHMGNERVTTMNLRVVQVDNEKGLLMVRGAVPGAPGSDVVVRPAVKSRVQAGQGT
jgi:large subunit ribosomal protein L3